MVKSLACQMGSRRKKKKRIVILTCLFLLGLVIVNSSSGYKLLATEDDYLQTSSALSEYIRTEYAKGENMEVVISKAKDLDNVGFTINYNKILEEVVILRDIDTNVKVYERINLN